MIKILLAIESSKRSGPTVAATHLIELLNEQNQVDLVYTYKHTSYIKNFIRSLRSDVFIFYSQTFLALLTMIIYKMMRKKVVYVLHGDIVREGKDKKGIKKLVWLPLHKLIFNIVDFIVSPSEYSFKINSENFAQIRNKHIVIPNPIINTKISRRGDDFSDLQTLRIVTQTSFRLEQKAKGIDTLMKIMDGIVGDWELFIIGDGHLLNQYKEKYTQSNVRFLGHVKDFNQTLNQYDLMMHISHLDNVPIVVEEALVARLPVIILDVGGVRELTREFVFDSVSDIKQYMKELFESPEAYLSNIQNSQLLLKDNTNIFESWNRLLKALANS